MPALKSPVDVLIVAVTKTAGSTLYGMLDVLMAAPERPSILSTSWAPTGALTCLRTSASTSLSGENWNSD
jgi:hypothetical protein